MKSSLPMAWWLACLVACVGTRELDPVPVSHNAANPNAAQQPNAAGSPNLPSVPAASYTAAACLADLERAMASAGDSNNMTDAQKTETVAAVLSAAQRHYPELPLQTVARIMVANMRQESDFQPANISGERDGSGNAYGLLQVSPFGNAKELALFAQHANVANLMDWRSQTALDANLLNANDLLDPWINVHVATWIQSNLARSGSADPTSWGVAQGPKPPTYLTGLGSWVAGPAADGSTGYGGSGDNISAPYFAGILTAFNVLTGTTNSTATLAALQVNTHVVWFKP